MLNTPFSPWPSFSQEEADACSQVLLSNKVNYWTGTIGREFEKEFAEWCGSTKAIAISNGTLAIDASLLALGIGRGDEVVVTSRTFLASASAIVSVGAVPVFADVDRDSQNITPATVERVLTSRTKAIVAVHLAGWPCEMDGLMDLAKSRGLAVIEDCAQAHGASYKGRSVGSLGHAAAWSFCQDKIMTTGGEGGMLTTSDERIWRDAWSRKDHGKSWEAVYEREHPPGFRWLHESFGTNWRMTEIQCALGRIQLRRMPQWHRQRTLNANALQEAMSSCPTLRVPLVPAHVEHAWYKCYAFVKPEALKADWSRDRIIAEIVARGVPAYSGSCSEIYNEKCFEGTGWRPSTPLPAAVELGATSLMFLVHPTLKASEIDKARSTIAAVAMEAAR